MIVIMETMTELNMRSEPGADKPLLCTLPAGTLAYVVGGMASADGYTWMNIAAPAPNGNWHEGWSVGNVGPQQTLSSIETKGFGSPVNERIAISQLFGENPAMYSPLGYRGHNGLDLATPVGTPIFSVTSGIAAHVRFDGAGYGHYVRVDGEGAIAIYAHLDQIFVSEGQPVNRGQAVGVSGNSGFSTAAHLHFELRLLPCDDNNGYGGRVDPLPHIDRKHLIIPDYAPAKFRKVIENG